MIPFSYHAGGKIHLLTTARPHFWRALVRYFVADEEMQVVLDRRQGERRQRVQPVQQERRQGERRHSSSIDLSEVHAYFGEGTRLKGTLTFRGAVRVDGLLEGDLVRGEVLVIGEQGLVKAHIDVGSLQVRGQVEGNITARQRVELLAPSRVTGTIRTPCLLIGKGAVLNGKCEMPEAQRDAGGST